VSSLHSGACDATHAAMVKANPTNEFETA